MSPSDVRDFEAYCSHYWQYSTRAPRGVGDSGAGVQYPIWEGQQGDNDNISQGGYCPIAPSPSWPSYTVRYQQATVPKAVWQLSLQGRLLLQVPSSLPYAGEPYAPDGAWGCGCPMCCVFCQIRQYATRPAGAGAWRPMRRKAMMVQGRSQQACECILLC